MDSKSSMFEKEVTMTLSGAGSSKKDAIGKIFSTLRTDIYKEVPEIIIHMEPKDVFIDKVDIKKYKEKFMFIFMPREKEEVNVTATIVVKVKYVKF